MTSDEFVERVRAIVANSRSIMDACHAMGKIQDLLKQVEDQQNVVSLATDTDRRVKQFLGTGGDLPPLVTPPPKDTV